MEGQIYRVKASNGFYFIYVNSTDSYKLYWIENNDVPIFKSFELINILYLLLGLKGTFDLNIFTFCI